MRALIFEPTRPNVIKLFLAIHRDSDYENRILLEARKSVKSVPHFGRNNAKEGRANKGRERRKVPGKRGSG